MKLTNKTIAVGLFIILSVAVAAMENVGDGSSNIIRLNALKEKHRMADKAHMAAPVSIMAEEVIDYPEVQIIRVKPEGRRLDAKRFEGATLARDLHATHIADEDMERKILDVLRWVKGKELEQSAK